MANYVWTTAQRERLRLEQRLLQSEGMTQFSVYYVRDRDDYYVFGRTQTNSGNTYGLWIPVPTGFPDSRPPLYVAEPNPLRSASGGTLNSYGLSHQMHTLAPGPGNQVQICHWRDNRWHAGIIILQVMVKGLLWLEAYEQHLQTGPPISTFVATMREK